MANLIFETLIKLDSAIDSNDACSEHEAILCSKSRVIAIEVGQLRRRHPIVLQFEQVFNLEGPVGYHDCKSQYAKHRAKKCPIHTIVIW